MKRHLYEVDGWGIGEVWVRDGVLVQHELASESLRSELAATATHPGPASPTGGARLPARTLAAESKPVAAECVADLCRRFGLHLGGDPITYDDVAIDLDWATPFQRELARAARSIPWGEVVSYGELAVLAGRPGAARAAGSFCADNRVSLVIPCHRIVGADGIGGYGPGGLPLKRRLLALEGVDL